MTKLAVCLSASQVFKIKVADGVLQSPECQECVGVGMPCMRTPSQGSWQRKKCDRCSCLRMHCSGAISSVAVGSTADSASPTKRRRRPAAKEKTFGAGSSLSTLMYPSPYIFQETGLHSALLNLSCFDPLSHCNISGSPGAQPSSEEESHDFKEVPMWYSESLFCFSTM
jgi:hypothetical protein